MQSVSICLVGLGMVAIGSAFMYLQYRGVAKWETVIAGVGVALIASGLAVIRDGAIGSREILWMLPSDGQQQFNSSTLSPTASSSDHHL